MIRGLKAKVSLGVLMVITTMFIGCETKKVEDNRPETKGFIWEATSPEGQTVTLVGTMHPAPSTYKLLNNKLQEIMAKTDVLTVEIDTSSNEVISKIQKSMYLPEGETIDDHLSEDEVNKLEEILTSYGQKIDDVKKLNGYGISQVILSNQLSEIKFNGSTTDTLLINFAKKNGITIDEIEGINFQLDIINKLYDWESVKESLGVDFESSKEESLKITNEIFEYYVNGDIDGAEKLEVVMREDAGEVYDMMNVDRNIGMANKIDEFIKDGKNRVVAVGYRHFIGEDSVLDYLEEKGYRIENIN